MSNVENYFAELPEFKGDLTKIIKISNEPTTNQKSVSTSSGSTKFKDFDSWSDADKALLVSIIADGAGLATSFGKGKLLRRISAISGLAGTAGQFVSDWKRDGLDTGDLVNLAANLAFDYGAIKGLPTGMTKWAHRVLSNNLVRTALKAAALGVGGNTAWNAVQAFNDMAKGDLSLDNVVNVVRGLQAFTAIQSANNFGKSSMNYTLHTKKGDVTLTKKELETLRTKTPEDRAAYLQERLPREAVTKQEATEMVENKYKQRLDQQNLDPEIKSKMEAEIAEKLSKSKSYTYAELGLNDKINGKDVSLSFKLDKESTSFGDRPSRRDLSYMESAVDSGILPEKVWIPVTSGTDRLGAVTITGESYKRILDPKTAIQELRNIYAQNTLNASMKSEFIDNLLNGKTFKDALKNKSLAKQIDDELLKYFGVTISGNNVAFTSNIAFKYPQSAVQIIPGQAWTDAEKGWGRKLITVDDMDNVANVILDKVSADPKSTHEAQSEEVEIEGPDGETKKVTIYTGYKNGGTIPKFQKGLTVTNLEPPKPDWEDILTSLVPAAGYAADTISIHRASKALEDNIAPLPVNPIFPNVAYRLDLSPETKAFSALERGYNLVGNQIAKSTTDSKVGAQAQLEVADKKAAGIQNLADKSSEKISTLNAQKAQSDAEILAKNLQSAAENVYNAGKFKQIKGNLRAKTTMEMGDSTQKFLENTHKMLQNNKIKSSYMHNLSQRSALLAALDTATDPGYKKYLKRYYYDIEGANAVGTKVAPFMSFEEWKKFNK